MGNPYDGRLSDAWAFGVMLYAILESRLPFDPPTSGKIAHRIARLDWKFYRLATDPSFSPASHLIAHLLKPAHSRFTIDHVLDCDWIRNGCLLDCAQLVDR
ncbi:Serine/threonine-protein kinase PRR1 [Neolecta irregularis DAH-3]|uniref:Serine/threonine-protein kinase PRR1 n=1 Tax=Neolecta irregularis (strain DAH-3) TaxID=1198029 RepID=A0A1U7LRA7_NEOID|nr:Serine/threonine-protein kinase PRR1 [Neolecta irregularis DAH-3]|eukprot:OLL25113.1 Serine/threonine-protein kinase PRR1 [Neolecta irregularis DAH-3]